MKYILLFLLLLPNAAFAQCLGQIKFGELVYDVEIAVSAEAHSRGLMFRETMPQNAGMLFLYPDDAPRYFWMRNTILSLDILFYRSNGHLQNAQLNARPYDETPLPGFGIAVLELNAGQFAPHSEAMANLSFDVTEQGSCPDAEWQTVLNHPLRRQ